MHAYLYCVLMKRCAARVLVTGAAHLHVELAFGFHVEVAVVAKRWTGLVGRGAGAQRSFSNW